MMYLHAYSKAKLISWALPFFPKENQINRYEMNTSAIVQYLLESAYLLSFTWVLIFSPIHISILSITLLYTQISILVSHELPFILSEEESISV